MDPAENEREQDNGPITTGPAETARPQRTGRQSPGRSPGPPPNPVRDPPHSPELERSVLSVLLDGGSAVAMQVVREVVIHPLAFFGRDHRLIYQACLDLDDAGVRVDMNSVMEQLRRSSFRVSLDRLKRMQILQEADELDRMDPGKLRSLYRFRQEDEAAGPDESTLAAIGGFTLLANLAGHYASAVGLRQNAATLWDYYLKRRLISNLTVIGDEAYQTTDDFPTLVDRAGQTVLKLSRLGGSRSVYPLGEVVDEALAAIGQKQLSSDTELRTGFGRLDERLNSLRPGGLYVLAARPGVGKTSFALSVIQNILRAQQERHVLFFSLEVGRVDLVNKLLSGFSEIDFRKIETGMLSPEETEVVHAVAEEMKGFNLALMDVSDLTVQGLRSAAKRYMLESEGRLGLLFLDYLQLLNSARPGQSEYEKVSDISRTLKVMAMELEIPIVAISQLSRESERGGSTPREPRLSDLRGSGSVEQDADAVIFLHRVDDADDDVAKETGREVKVTIAKNRFGPTGWEPVRFFPARQRFVTVAKQENLDRVMPQDPPPPGGHGRYDSSPSEDEHLFGD